MPENNGEKHVLVLGAGFGGLSFCQNFRHDNTRIALIDRQNHHLFQPLLYQVATSGLSATDIAQPVRSLVNHRPDISVYLGEAKEIDLDRRRVHFDEATLPYEYLVLALGGVTSYFGHPEWAGFAPGLKNLDDAQRIRKNVLYAFEQAEIELDPEKRRRLMTVVVVGGGPTGVEMAGALAELAKRVLRTDFRHIDPASARVILIESGDVVLDHMGAYLGHQAQDCLRKMGVEVRTNVRVDDMREGWVHLNDGREIHTANIIWAAGVGANPLTRQLDVPQDRAGRIQVEPDLSLPGHPEVFAIGDLVSLQDGHGNPIPGVSPAAIQMGAHAARQVRSELERGVAPGASQREAFSYWDKGTMATIGRSKAVAMLGRLQFSGFPAWFLWLVVHLLFLVDLKNKVIVLFRWMVSYFTYSRGARIFTLSPKPEQEGKVAGSQRD